MRKWVLALVVLLTIFSSGCLYIIPAIGTFDVIPGTITAGQAATLIWNVNGASSVTIDRIGAVDYVGAQSVMPPVTTAYNIRARNFMGEVSKSVVLIVNPQPVTINFEVNPATVSAGGYSTLTWNVIGATSVSIDQGIGQIPLTGSKLVNPQVTTNYTMTASNIGGTSSRSVTLVVNPPVVASITASPSTMLPGQSATLQWNVTGATLISIEPGIGDVPASGSKTVYPTITTTYTLIASSECCAVSKSAVVTVGRPYMSPYPYPYSYPYSVPFIEIFNVSPPAIKVGQAATLSWYVVGADTIYISGIGNVSYSGSVHVLPTSTASYVMTASNGYFTRTRTVTVAVVP